MNTLIRTIAILALLGNSACSTVVEGSTQQIKVVSEPQGAHCLFKQADDIVATVTTPGTAEIPKSKNDLVIYCSKDGYESVSLKNRSDMAITSLGNMAFYQLSFIGNAVDSATGAANKYDSNVFVKLVPANEPTAFPAPPGSAPVAQLPMQSLAGYSMQVPMPMGAVPLPAAPAAMPLPAPAPAAAITPAAIAANPSLKAAVNLADAARKVIAQDQLPPMNYAQTTAAMPGRPPFNVIQ